MRLLADENVPDDLIDALRADGHDVLRVRDSSPGARDEAVLARAVEEQRILITSDKDFGDLAFARRLSATTGVILMRLRGSPATRRQAVLQALATRGDWAGRFTVIENDRVRTTRVHRPED